MLVLFVISAYEVKKYHYVPFIFLHGQIIELFLSVDFPLGPRLFGMCEFSKGDEILCVRIMHGKSNKRFFQEAISTSSGCVTGFIWYILGIYFKSNTFYELLTFHAKTAKCQKRHQ